MKVLKHFLPLILVALLLGYIEGLILPFPIAVVTSLCTGLLLGTLWSILDDYRRL